MAAVTKSKKTAPVRKSVKKRPATGYRTHREASGLSVTSGPVRVTSEQIRALSADVP